MLYTIRNMFTFHTNENLSIVSENGCFGIQNKLDNSFIIPLEYDNIFLYGESLFVLYQKGKIGAVRIEENKRTFKVIIVADCQYDTLSNAGHDLFFSCDDNIRYYNAVTKKVRDFIDVNADEYPCLYCKDKTHQYILYGELGEEIYKKEYTSYSESCFTCCGMTEQGPVFYDARYSTYLYPENGFYKVYKGIFNHPIIMNHQNILNITEDGNGLGLIDSCGNVMIENNYDSVTIELTITAVKGNKKEQKIIPFQRFHFEKGIVS